MCNGRFLVTQPRAVFSVRYWAIQPTAKFTLLLYLQHNSLLWNLKHTVLRKSTLGWDLVSRQCIYSKLGHVSLVNRVIFGQGTSVVFSDYKKCRQFLVSFEHKNVHLNLIWQYVSVKWQSSGHLYKIQSWILYRWPGDGHLTHKYCHIYSDIHFCVRRKPETVCISFKIT